MLSDMLGRSVSPVFVGRSDELTALGEAFEEACRGNATAVLLGGEAGVGKTRLVHRFAEQIGGARVPPGQAGDARVPYGQAGDARVLYGGCVELSSEGLAYAPFTAALRQLVREQGAGQIAALLPDGAARDLARLLPEFGEAGGDGETDTSRARLFEQFLTLLERLADSTPTVLIIEDVHWADRSSRDLIAFLSRNLRIPQVLMVMTYRSDDLHRQHPLRPVLAELGRVNGVLRLDLPRLSRDEVAQQMTGILGSAPQYAKVQKVYERSEGIPLFVEAMLEGGEDCTFPDSMQDLILAAVERLPEETQRVLRIAAAGGTRVGHALLAAVSGLSELELEAALRPAVAGNVLQIADGRAYVFRHSLIREAVHEELLPGEHQRLHARYAEEISQGPRARPARTRRRRARPPLVRRPQRPLSPDRRLAGRGQVLQGVRLHRGGTTARTGAHAVGPGAGRGRADRRGPHRGAGEGLGGRARRRRGRQGDEVRQCRAGGAGRDPRARPGGHAHRPPDVLRRFPRAGSASSRTCATPCGSSPSPARPGPRCSCR